MDPREKAQQEFVAEAQETVEALNRALLRLDAGRGGGETDPEILSDAFRAAHTLKGLAGLAGQSRMSQVAHHLEDLLDGLRLGRLAPTAQLQDLLFDAVELFQRLVAAAAPGEGPRTDDSAEAVVVEDLLGRIQRLASRPGGGEPATVPQAIDPALLAVLTEYEEHRLRENLRRGHPLYRIHIFFPLATIDERLDELKRRLKPIGEVITFLPGAAPTDPDALALELVLGSPAPLSAVQEAVSGLAGGVEEMLRPAPAVADIEPLSPSTPATAVEPAPAADGAARTVGAAPSLRSAAQTVRVDIRKLDQLMNIVGELTVVRAGIQRLAEQLLGEAGRWDLTRSLSRDARLLGRKLAELQAAVLEVRMVPLGQLFEKLSRVVRKLYRESGKEVRFLVSGGETELDKLIVEELSDPLMHVLRNAIDHGIEAAAVRRDAGKPDAGTVAVAAEQRGNHVVITVEDDGAGIDTDRLLARAVAQGLVPAAGAGELSRRELHNLIFVPGLSTRDAANELSGRGVGMDVVKTNLARLSGIIDVESELGVGTRLTLTLPITLAILPALIVRAGGRTWAIPLNSVLESALLLPAELRVIEGRQVMSLRGLTLMVSSVEELFGLPAPARPPGKRYVVVVGLAEHRVGLIIDELVGQQDIVVKSLGRTLDGVVGIAGATDLGDQELVLVLDVAALIDEAIGGQAIEAAS